MNLLRQGSLNPSSFGSPLAEVRHNLLLHAMVNRCRMGLISHMRYPRARQRARHSVALYPRYYFSNSAHLFALLSYSPVRYCPMLHTAWWSLRRCLDCQNRCGLHAIFLDACPNSCIIFIFNLLERTFTKGFALSISASSHAYVVPELCGALP